MLAKRDLTGTRTGGLGLGLDVERADARQGKDGGPRGAVVAVEQDGLGLGLVAHGEDVRGVEQGAEHVEPEGRAHVEPRRGAAGVVDLAPLPLLAEVLKLELELAGAELDGPEEERAGPEHAQGGLEVPADHLRAVVLSGGRSRRLRP